MPHGKVAWFNNEKGFGFLTSDEGPDVFVHYTAIRSEGFRALKDDEEVEFDIEIGPTGRPQAANVQRLRRKNQHPPTHSAGAPV